MKQEKDTIGFFWVNREEGEEYVYTMQVLFDDKRNLMKSIKEEFQGWVLSAEGFDPNRKKIIHIYKKKFETKQKTNFIKKYFSFEIKLVQ